MDQRSRPGANGTNGNDGANGTNGVDGATGPAGSPGLNGADGTNGIDGGNGNDGAAGAQGPAGSPGVDGTNGIDGAAGADGSDATNFWTESGANLYRSSGNVGIGTTSPAYKLDVRGSGDQVINLYSNGTGAAYARFSANNNLSSAGLLYAGADQTSTFLNSRYNFPMVFHTYNTERMRISSSGNVGIGTTTPVSALHVKTTTQFQGIFLDDESGLIAKIARGDATGDPYFKLYSSISSNGVDIQSNGSSYFNGGNVGIGTTTPTHLLTLQRTSDSGYDGINFKKSTGESRAIIMTNPSGNGYMQLHDNSNTYNEVLIHSSGDSYFNGGNVGIGIVTPTHPLHIQGPGTGGQLLKLSGTSNTWLELEADYDGTPQGWGLASYETGSFHFYKRTGTAGGGTIGTKMTITGQGNVGIGTTTPD